MDGFPLRIPKSSIARVAQEQDGDCRVAVNLDLGDQEHYVISYPIADNLPGSLDGQELRP